MTELLSAYPIVRSSDLDEVCEAVGKVVCPHRLDPLPHHRGGVCVFNEVAFHDVAVSYAELGVPVRVRHEPLETTMLIRFTLSGALNVRSGRDDLQFDRHVGAIFHPQAAYDVSIDSGTRALVLRVHRSAVHAELRRILGHPPKRKLHFQSSFPIADPHTCSWLAMLHALCVDLNGPHHYGHPALRQPIQRLIITQLLTTLQHSFSDQIAGTGSAKPESVGSRTIRRADQVIRDHCNEPLTVSDIAEAVGISVRSLQSGFQRYLDTTPSERLRQARLAAVHTELLTADPARVSVAHVAAKWGLHHRGRFSQHYRTAYGETPSHTLRR